MLILSRPERLQCDIRFLIITCPYLSYFNHFQRGALLKNCLSYDSRIYEVSSPFRSVGPPCPASTIFSVAMFQKSTCCTPSRLHARFSPDAPISRASSISNMHLSTERSTIQLQISPWKSSSYAPSHHSSSLLSLQYCTELSVICLHNSARHTFSETPTCQASAIFSLQITREGPSV